MDDFTMWGETHKEHINHLTSGSEGQIVPEWTQDRH